MTFNPSDAPMASQLDWTEPALATLRDGHLPGLSVAVVRDDDLVWAGSFGLAELDPPRPVLHGSVFRCASITKLFTATSILILRDEGKLSLDDRVADVVPAFPRTAITIRHLLCHGSGLQRETPDDPGWQTGEFLEGDAFLRALSRAELIYPPMEVWKYSNLGYNVLGEVIGAVSGEPYPSFVTSRVIRPLGLASTSFDPTSFPAGALARGYERTPVGDEVRPDPRTWDPVPAPAGQLFATATDLARFASFLCGSRGDEGPLVGSTLVEMRTPRIIADERWGLGHGLGPMLVRDEDVILVGHAGEVGGFGGWALGHPASRVGVACLTNVADAEPLLPLAVRLAREAEPAEPEDVGTSPAPEGIAEVLGRYFGDGMLLRLSWKRGTLVAEWPTRSGRLGAPPTELRPEGPDRFRFGPSGLYAGEPLELRRSSRGEIEGFEVCMYRFDRV